MNLPHKEDYIDMHTHGGKPAEGVFIIESLMAHENKFPGNDHGIAYTFGIHPWFLNENNYKNLINSVEYSVNHPNVIAIGEAGFDRLRGPSPVLQRNAFEAQVALAEMQKKPVIVHCVRAWDELLAAQKKLRPKTPWMIHGFRGNIELARQLLSKGMYLSFWFDFIIRPESANLLRSIPRERFFLETDGADVDIRNIYKKVSDDLGITINELKTIILSNFNGFFDQKEGN